MNEEEVDCVGSGLAVEAFVVVVVVIVVVVVVDFGVVVGRENCHLPTLSGLMASGLKDCISELKRSGFGDLLFGFFDFFDFFGFFDFLLFFFFFDGSEFIASIMLFFLPFTLPNSIPSKISLAESSSISRSSRISSKIGRYGHF